MSYNRCLSDAIAAKNTKYKTQNIDTCYRAPTCWSNLLTHRKTLRIEGNDSQGKNERIISI